MPIEIIKKTEILPHPEKPAEPLPVVDIEEILPQQEAEKAGWLLCVDGRSRWWFSKQEKAKDSVYAYGRKWFKNRKIEVFEI